MNIKVSYRLISTLWASKMPTRWYYHYCWVWSSILKVLKVISLQYLYNISKKEVRKGVHFLHADEHQSFYKLELFFWWKWPDMPKVPKMGSWWYFCKECCSYFCVLFWCKTFTYFTGVQPYLLLLVSSHSQTRNIIIKQQLSGEGFPSLLPLLQADVFQQKQ